MANRRYLSLDEIPNVFSDLELQSLTFLRDFILDICVKLCLYRIND